MVRIFTDMLQVMCEQRIEQQHEIMKNIGIGREASRLRAEIQGQSVLSGKGILI